jgi:predicted amidophosphoribosyltransferase
MSPPARAAVDRLLPTPLLELLAPQRCLACRRRASPPWCPRCVREVAPAGPCPRCAGPRGGHRCWPPDGPVTSTRALFDYRGVVARAIVTAKLTGARPGWWALGSLLGRRLAEEPPEVDAVTWVTTAPSRRRRRGLDHAAVLAEAVAAWLDLPVVALLEVHTSPRRAERFVARARLPGTELLLVDDVLTTGRTLAAAAAELRRAGAGNVRTAVISRAGSHDLGPFLSVEGTTADGRGRATRRDDRRREGAVLG